MTLNLSLCNSTERALSIKFVRELLEQKDSYKGPFRVGQTVLRTE